MSWNLRFMSLKHCRIVDKKMVLIQLIVLMQQMFDSTTTISVIGQKSPRFGEKVRMVRVKHSPHLLLDLNSFVRQLMEQRELALY